MGRLGEQAVDVVPERELEAKGHPAWAAADAARQVDKQRMVGVHYNPHVIKLLFHPFTGHRVAEEQGAGVLVVDEETVGVAFGLLAALLHRHPVILGVFHHDGAMFA